MRVRPNSDEGSELPLQIELTKASPEKSKYSAATYQIDVPEAGLYTFRLHAKGADANVNISVGDKATDVSLSPVMPTNGQTMPSTSNWPPANQV